MSDPHLAVVGATGAVGSIVRRLLAERNFPCRSIKFLASQRSVGKEIEFKGAGHPVELLEPAAFEGVDIVIASTPDDVATEFVPWAIERGAVVIDESGAHRMKEDVPLVIPEVNPEVVQQHKGLIASPNCSTTQMVVALKPLHDAAKLRRVIVSTYQAASGAGVGGVRDLFEGSRADLNSDEYELEAMAHPIAFNLIPQIGSFKEEGYTSEEWKMVFETHKILGDDQIRISPTCVRVPVSNCHSEAIWIETEQPLAVETAKSLLSAAEGIQVVDDPLQAKYPMPNDCSDRDEVYVGRIRKDISSDNGLSFWCVSDNLRKGAATNAVQIAELLVKQRSISCVSSN